MSAAGKRVAATDAPCTVRRQAFEEILTVKHLPNIITLSRVPILFVIAGLIELAVPAATNAQSAHWCATIAFVLYVLAAKTDGWPLPEVVIHAFDFGGVACFHVAAVLTVTSGAGYLIKYWDVFMGDPETPGKA